MHLPAFLRRGREAEGFDASTGWMLRLVGVAVLALVAFGLAMFIMGIVTLSTLRNDGDQTGWDGLIAGIALGLGGFMVIGGSLVTWACHAAFSGWRERRAKPVRISGWILVVAGLAGPIPFMIQGLQTPLDRYMVIAWLVLLALGAVLLAWAAQLDKGLPRQSLPTP